MVIRTPAFLVSKSVGFSEHFTVLFLDRAEGSLQHPTKLLRNKAISYKMLSDRIIDIKGVGFGKI
jgi:hypothetical protein